MQEEKELLTYTLVLHQARKKLGLILNEYCIADTIYHLQNNPSSKVKGWCYASKKTLGKFIGITEQSVHSIANKLIEKGIVEKDPDTRYLRTTKIWYDNVILLRLHSRNLRDTKETLVQHSRNLRDTKETLVQHSRNLSQRLKKLEPATKETLDNSNRDSNKINIKEEFIPGVGKLKDAKDVLKQKMFIPGTGKI